MAAHGTSGEPRHGSGEDDLIARYFKPLATAPGAFALTDDAAVLAGTGDDLVVTADAVVEGVHFLPDDPPDTVARKALRVNLSDLAAKGARPAGFMMTLALPGVDDAWLAPFAHALGEDAAGFGCPLLGGDTVATPGPLSISITAFGHVPKGQMVRRAGARTGDAVVVSGSIGDAVAGLHALRRKATSEVTAPLVARYRVPQPRLALAPLLRRYATAAMDISDGLAGDLAKLCAASGLSARVDAARVPVSTPATALLAADSTLTREALLTGGDDYEILCAVPPAGWDAFRAAGEAAGVPLTVIGTVTAGAAPPLFLDAQGQPLTFARAAFSHF